MKDFFPPGPCFGYLPSSFLRLFVTFGTSSLWIDAFCIFRTNVSVFACGNTHLFLLIIRRHGCQGVAVKHNKWCTSISSTTDNYSQASCQLHVYGEAEIDQWTCDTWNFFFSNQASEARIFPIRPINTLFPPVQGQHIATLCNCAPVCTRNSKLRVFLAI